MWATEFAPKILGISMARVEKSSPPARRLVIGMMMSSTRDLTIAVKAPPTATPMARSTTDPRLMNSLNSLINELLVTFSRRLVLGADFFMS